MSTYVMLVASSRFILVDVNVVIVGHGGGPPVKDQVISLKPSSDSFGGPSREGSGIGDPCSEVELESPIHFFFVLPSNDIGPFSY